MMLIGLYRRTGLETGPDIFPLSRTDHVIKDFPDPDLIYLIGFLF